MILDISENIYTPLQLSTTMTIDMLWALTSNEQSDSPENCRGNGMSPSFTKYDLFNQQVNHSHRAGPSYQPLIPGLHAWWVQATCPAVKIYGVLTGVLT